MTKKKALEILAMCEQHEKDTLSFTAFIKAEMNAYLGGVGTAPDRQTKKLQLLAEKEAKIKAKFWKK